MKISFPNLKLFITYLKEKKSKPSFRGEAAPHSEWAHSVRQGGRKDRGGAGGESKKSDEFHGPEVEPIK